MSAPATDAAAAIPSATQEFVPPEDVRGVRRLCLLFRTTDPEPVEMGNLFFLAIMVATYLPKSEAMLYDPFTLEVAALLAPIGLVVIPLALYAILWQPAGVLRRVTLMVKAAIWMFIGTGVGQEIGPSNIRTAFCAALTLSTLWAAYRVGQRPS